MQSLSVVIICKNEAGIIGKTLQSLEGLTDDIIVYDNGSTDDTVAIAKKFPVTVYESCWTGFGRTKNMANEKARYDWILSLDADEAIDEELKKSLLALSLTDEKTVYEIKFKNFFGTQWLRFGEWGNDKHIRLYDRRQVNWDEEPVHEKLVLPAGTGISRLKGNILHYTAIDLEKYRIKLSKYAVLNAEKYYEQGKKTGAFRKYAAGFFSFLQNYIFRAGFLDGKGGYRCAMMTSRYTYDKYKNLEKMSKQIKDNNE
ncbi:MAG TPA: glycosyltransferase family 2 protein [Chitinophagaceae bacterium]|jgi:glycosyltransferase involved in cell wall biosynthesis|nr:glycosyltransferase family 2 protein [Chitinophagaceae bacterium]